MLSFDVLFKLKENTKKEKKIAAPQL